MTTNNKTTISHGYNEAEWWYKEFITKEEWKRKTAWIPLDAGSKEYKAALVECYRDLLNAYWSLNRLTDKDSYEFWTTNRKMWDLWREFLHAKESVKAMKDFPEMCNMSFENQTVKEPFVIQ